VLFSAVASTLSGRFVSAVDDDVEQPEGAVTLYSALLETFGLGSADSTLSASNHAELKAAISWFYATLDDVVGDRSEPWAMRAGRTESEVLDALGRASRRFPVTEFDDLRAVLRTGLHKVPGRGKIRGAVAVEATRVARVTGRSFSLTIGDTFVDGVSDADGLSALERVVGHIEVKGTDWAPAIAWSRGYNDFLASEPADVSLMAFCKWISDDWSLSDGDLVQRLDSLRRVRGR
jgi:hypothetical protein